MNKKIRNRKLWKKVKSNKIKILMINKSFKKSILQTMIQSKTLALKNPSNEMNRIIKLPKMKIQNGLNQFYQAIQNRIKFKFQVDSFGHKRLRYKDFCRANNTLNL